MVQELKTNFDEHIRPKITQEQFDEFDRCYVMYVLADKRYGQAFIEHFELGNATPLYHFKDRQICRDWIVNNYIE
jgi:hypothetical protein